jgi:hypothetical protein
MCDIAAAFEYSMPSSNAAALSGDRPADAAFRRFGGAW